MCFYDAKRLQLTAHTISVLKDSSLSKPDKWEKCLSRSNIPYTWFLQKHKNNINIDTRVTKVQFDMETDFLDINVSCDSILLRSVPQFMQSNKNSNMLINKTNLCTYPTAKAAIYKDINYSKN